MGDARVELEDWLHLESDVDVERISSEIEDYESSPAKYKISTYPADFALEVLWSKWRAGKISIPKFQRQFVWKQVQASKLIESFLAGLPVPAVFLYTERKSQKYIVIDGQQKLTDFREKSVASDGPITQHDRRLFLQVLLLSA